MRSTERGREDESRKGPESSDLMHFCPQGFRWKKNIFVATTDHSWNGGLSYKLYNFIINILKAAHFPKLIEYDWALQPAEVNKSINLGTINPQRIDLALKRQSCDVISPMHCLTCLKKVAELGCHQVTFGANLICLLFWECSTLFNKLLCFSYFEKKIMIYYFVKFK